ncbi:unnamed protein product [Polarella glacialis]|uniref:SnoaL-like domain-containing protein n=1 Tax=Polarella glacialis TaxID=89957 RepID=A0A813H0J7_POLGL|nr:unnamed protein product [Polarella glacialis]
MAAASNNNNNNNTFKGWPARRYQRLCRHQRRALQAIALVGLLSAAFWWQPSSGTFLTAPAGSRLCRPVRVGFYDNNKRAGAAQLRHSRIVTRAAPETGSDFLSGQNFSRKALLLFETERNTLVALIFVSALIAFVGITGLLYNAVGQVALFTTPGAKPGIDSLQSLLIQASALLLGGFGFFNLNGRRTSILRRLDAEISFERQELELQDGIGLVKKLSDFKSTSSVLALFGPSQEELHEALREAEAYRRRWSTSGIVVVSVGALPSGMGGSWLAQAKDPDAWLRSRQKLMAASETNSVDQAGMAWILWNRGGRLSGESQGKNFDQVLAFVGIKKDLSALPSRAPELPSETTRAALEEVLSVHDSFYEALKGGDVVKMLPLWNDPGPEVDSQPRVPWESILSDQAAVLDVVDVDVVFTKPGIEATVTSIEVVRGEGGFMNEGGPGGKGTLLATKRLRREEGPSGGWRLISHQTIPYCSNTIARQSLSCTSQGCILLKG